MGASERPARRRAEPRLSRPAAVATRPWPQCSARTAIRKVAGASGLAAGDRDRDRSEAHAVGAAPLLVEEAAVSVSSYTPPISTSLGASYCSFSVPNWGSSAWACRIRPPSLCCQLRRRVRDRVTHEREPVRGSVFLVRQRQVMDSPHSLQGGRLVPLRDRFATAINCHTAQRKAGFIRRQLAEGLGFRGR